MEATGSTLGVKAPTQRRVVRSEWTKLISLRSTRWALAAMVLLAIGIGVIVCSVFESRWGQMSASDRAEFHPLSACLAGIGVAQLATGVLGVLAITGEYSTGMIRSSLTAVPRRLSFLTGKALAFGATALAISLPATFVTFFVGQAILSGEGIGVGIGDPGVLRALVGAGLFLATIGLFGLALGAMARNTAAGIAALVGILFVLPPIVYHLPSGGSIYPYLPSSAGSAVWTTEPGPHTLAPWVGFGVLCAYVVVAFAVAAIQMMRRDA